MHQKEVDRLGRGSRIVIEARIKLMGAPNFYEAVIVRAFNGKSVTARTIDYASGTFGRRQSVRLKRIEYVKERVPRGKSARAIDYGEILRRPL